MTIFPVQYKFSGKLLTGSRISGFRARSKKQREHSERPCASCGHIRIRAWGSIGVFCAPICVVFIWRAAMPKRGRDDHSGRNRRSREEAEETAAALATQGARNRRPRVMDDVGCEMRGVGRRLSGAGGMRRARARGEHRYNYRLCPHPLCGLTQAVASSLWPKGRRIIRYDG